MNNRSKNTATQAQPICITDRAQTEQSLFARAFERSARAEQARRIRWERLMIASRAIHAMARERLQVTLDRHMLAALHARKDAVADWWGEASAAERDAAGRQHELTAMIADMRRIGGAQ